MRSMADAPVMARRLDPWTWPPFTGWRVATGTDPDGRRGYALFGDPGPYRFALRRDWDLNLPTMVFIMLNPSTAGATVNDQTVRQCIVFAVREGCGSVLVVNLFAYIATDPAALALDPVGGKLNDWCISQAVAEAQKQDGGRVVVAWGAQGARFAQRTGEVLGIVYRRQVLPEALGFTKGGQPRHPCRLAHDTPLLAVPF